MVNLTGQTINCRHTPENRREILHSRTDSVHVLGDAIAQCLVPPPVFVQASGVGFYGDSADRVVDETTPGVFNATAPTPVTNAEFMRQLRRALHRPWSPPVPAPIVRLGAWLMRTEGSLALTSLRCLPTRSLTSGFAFRFPNLPAALAHLYPK